MDQDSQGLLRTSVVTVLNELKSAMEADGGGAELVSFENDSVTVRLVGSCLFCPSRKLSAAALERGLRLRVAGLGPVNIVCPEPDDNAIR